MPRRQFVYNFEDESPDAISYDVGNDETLRTGVDEGVPVISANRAGLLALARLLIKLSAGDYQSGFDVHLRSDFAGDANLPDVLTVVLNE